MFLIDDILFAPLKGIVWLGNQIDEIVRRESSDSRRIKEKLMELQLRFELDEIGEEDYDRQERELLSQLDAMQNEEV